MGDKERDGITIIDVGLVTLVLHSGEVSACGGADVGETMVRTLAKILREIHKESDYYI